MNKLIMVLFPLILLSCTKNEDKSQEEVNYVVPSETNLVEVLASSALKDDSYGSYGVSNLTDNTHLSWVEAEEGSGIGTTIVYKYNTDIKVSEISIVNGYGDLSMYHKNNRVKKVKISSDLGDSVTLELLDTYLVKKYPLSTPVKGKVITVTIDEVYKGTKWDDTAITELSLSGTINYEYSIDFEALLIPQSYIEQNKLFERYQRDFQLFLDSLNGEWDYYNDYKLLLDEYPQYAKDFPEFTEGDSGETNTIYLTHSDYTITGVVEYGGMIGSSLPDIYSQRSFLLTENGEYLVIEANNSYLGFLFDGESIPLSSYIDIKSDEEVFPQEVPENLMVKYSYNDFYLSVGYYDSFSYDPMYAPDPIKSIEYKWNGKEFICQQF